MRDRMGVFVAHTGKVGGGREGISKRAFLRSYPNLQEVEWPDGRKTALVVIGRLSSSSFMSNLANFVFDVERFKARPISTESLDQQLRRDAEEADQKGDFDPGSAKENIEKVLRSVNLRRGQPDFRRQLLQAYGRRCAVTGCDCVDVLEAAHIRPYSGDDTDHVQNGLLLRGDLHTLFDLRKLGVDPRSYTVVLSKSLKGTAYAKLQGTRLRRPKARAYWPNKEVLQEHLKGVDGATRTVA